MKEKELEKHLENLIINGLRKEAEHENAEFEVAMRKMKQESFEEMIDRPIKTKWPVFRPWIISAISSAAIVLLVLLPTLKIYNAQLCESALYASEQYLTAPKGGFDVVNASLDSLRKELPNIEVRYKECISGRVEYFLPSDLQNTGWDLVVAYLRLHEKDKAVKILKDLNERYRNTEFGRHCSELLKNLD